MNSFLNFESMHNSTSSKSTSKVLPEERNRSAVEYDDSLKIGGDLSVEEMKFSQLHSHRGKRQVKV